jgi:hypothetical protein
MNILYIGGFAEGTTSKMRGQTIKSIHKTAAFHVIDTLIPYNKSIRIWKSIAFRFKIGPVIWRINSYIKENINDLNYDLIWVDKGVFVKKNTLSFLKTKTKKLVHFTPDCAFYANKSRFFIEGIGLYDFLITTKSFELNNYKFYCDKKKIILTTQGYSKSTHFSIPSDNKRKGCVFIGLGEKSRYELVRNLLDNNIHVSAAGVGWRSFSKTLNEHAKLYFTYLGEGLYSNDYRKTISTYEFGLGLLSKNFPELHTTRTFEIPACSTALLTERNIETNTFFNENEVIFYSNIEELIEKIKYFQRNKSELHDLTVNGYKRVSRGQYDYKSILQKILTQVFEN